MPWFHNDEKNTLNCLSEKHNREVIIDLNNPPKDCKKCRRNCFFWKDREGKITIRFDPNKKD